MNHIKTENSTNISSLESTVFWALYQGYRLKKKKKKKKLAPLLE